MLIFLSGLYMNSHLNQGYSFLILTFMSNCPVVYRHSLLQITFGQLIVGHHMYLKDSCHFGKEIIYNTLCTYFSLWDRPGEQVSERRKGNSVENFYK
jgi:hypothetical protein